MTALAFKTAVDDPSRFRRSRTVGAHFGLTPRRFQSGTIDYSGRITRCGDPEVRTALYTAASSMLTRSRKWSALRAWGMSIAQRRGHKKVVVAVARKLAIVLHCLCATGASSAGPLQSRRRPSAERRHDQTSVIPIRRESNRQPLTRSAAADVRPVVGSRVGRTSVILPGSLANQHECSARLAPLWPAWSRLFPPSSEDCMDHHDASNCSVFWTAIG